MFSIIRPFLFNLDPETTHNLAIKSLKLNCLPKTFFKLEDESLLSIDIFNKKFPNPIGLAAGFDKSAEVYNNIFNLGFGFVEVGTITPLKQYGNEKPRVFRLPEDEALINRLGFNNDGADIIHERIMSNPKTGILGVNIGPNKDTGNQQEDFCKGLEKFFNLSDYVTINISSPNTEKLRDFHEKKQLQELLSSLNKIKNEKKSTVPLLLKISPDINDNYIDDISELVINNNVSGIILTNTTNTNRNNLVNSLKNESGGLSGKPLRKQSTDLIRKFYKKIGNNVVIIGVGGIDSGRTAYEKILAGASLLQLYTGLVYKGPLVVKAIKNELIINLKKDGFKNLKEAVGKNS